MVEYRDLYDANKCVTGKTFIKGEQVLKGYFYLIVIIVIKNSLDKYLIQKRVERKGGKWALTGGHPKAGESSLEGIKEEVKEELGIDINNDNVKLPPYDKNGSGTPVSGIRPNNPPKLIAICINIYVATPIHTYLFFIELVILANLKILYIRVI